jgi:hypothetical protein
MKSQGVAGNDKTELRMRRRLIVLAASLLMSGAGCCLSRTDHFVDFEDAYDRLHCGHFCYNWWRCPFSCPECPYFNYDECRWINVPSRTSVIAEDSYQHPNLSIPIQQ